MKYSPLIRKLLNASTDAKYQQKDVADWLKERCTDDSDLIVLPKIRQGLTFFIRQISTCGLA